MRRMKTIAKRWPALLFALVILFSGVTAWHFAYHITDSDAACELVLGKILADDNKIVTTDWLYGNEMRMFNTNLVFMPLFKIFDDWHTVRFAGILIFQALLALSYFYLSRRMKIKPNAFFLSASLLLLPVNVVYGRLGLFHNYYTPCFIFGFFIAGLYLSVLEHRGQNRPRQALRVAAMLLLSLMSSMNGFRQLPGTMVPLLATALLVALKNRRDAHETLAEIPVRSWQNAGLAGAAFLAGVAGLYVHSNVLSKIFHVRGLHLSIVALPTVENLRNLAVGYLSLFGYQEGRALFSVGGILSLGAAFAAAALLIISLGDMVPRKRPGNSPAAFMGTFYPVAMLCMTVNFFLVLGNENYPQYYLPAFMWVFPYLGFLLDRMPVPIRKLSVKQAAAVLACAVLLLNGLYYDRYYIKPDGKQVEYDIRIDIHTMDRLAGAARFIRENGLAVGYAEFWDAAVVTEATGGKALMIPLSYDTTHLTISDYDVLVDLRWRDISTVENKSVFLLLSDRYVDFFSQTELAQRAALVYEDTYYRIYTFDSSTAVWEYLNP